MSSTTRKVPVPEPDPAQGPYGWIRANRRLPEKGQEVYYFGPQLGIHIGIFDSTPDTHGWAVNDAGEEVKVELPELGIELNPNKFLNNNWGVVDTDDAPWWQPYNAERAKSWCPLPPDYRLDDDEL